MPQGCWRTLVLCLPWLLSGCLGADSGAPSAWLKRFQNNAILPDHALLEVAILEVPIGDDYINTRIWQHTDELIVDLERRAALEENGLRIGQLVGAAPDGLQKLLLSNRTCNNSHALIFPPGKTMPIWLSATLPRTFFDFVQGTRRTEMTFDQARHGLDVTAEFAADGRTTFTLTPKVENGEHLFPFKAVPERSTWELRIEKAAKKFPDLSFEVTLGANQFLIVGTRLDRARTLGLTAFTELHGSLGVQKLLVIRNRRSVTALEAHDNTVADLIAADKTPPLALQATLPVSRAKR